jgi:hypothetical protein
VAVAPRKYSDAQRDAIAHAYNRRNLRPAGRIERLAAAGELRAESGELLPAFAIPASSVRDIARAYRAKAAGLARSQLARSPDAVELLRRRLIAATDAELQRIERAQQRRQPLRNSAELLRALARAAREIAALPAAGSQQRSAAPERRAPRGLAGAIAAAAAPAAIAAPTAPAAHAVREPDAVDSAQPAGDPDAIAAEISALRSANV